MNYFNKDWYGKPCPQAGYEISKHEDWSFKVAVAIAAEQIQLAPSGEYREGLWKQDVAEWFIVNPDTGRYLECNLSANGAWWMMVFNQPRLREPALLPALTKVHTQHRLQKNSWQAELSIPESLLINILGEADWRYNVCFILGQQPRQYLSLTSFSSEHPDFHRPHEIKTSMR